jgi:diguanylate cyclase (GGDEF)-like protein
LPDSILHLPTLIAFSLLINTVIGVYLFILYKRKPKDRCFKYWALSCFSFVWGGIASTGRAYDFMPFVSYFIADALLIAAPLFVFAGLVKFSRFRFTKRKRRYAKLCVVGTVTALLVTHPFPQLINIFAALVMAILFWICSQLIAKSVFNEPIYTRILRSIFILHSLTMLIKLAIYATQWQGVGENDSSNITIIVLLSHMMLTTLTALLLPWLAFLKLERKLILKSQRDGLTKLANREHFFTSVERHWAKYKHKPVMIMMIDIDHFKTVNDNHGHIVGDRVIKKVASTLSKSLRSHDLLGRIGGEEFAVLIANESLDTAKQIAERLLKQIENASFSIDGQTVNVTVSIGMMEATPSQHAMLEAFSIADKALYTSKHEGRNMLTIGALA